MPGQTGVGTNRATAASMSSQVVGGESRYRERPLSSELLRCRWQQTTGRESDYLQRVLPDGCADVLVDAQGDAVLVGPTALPAVVRLAAGTAYQCVRLRPGTIQRALGIPGPTFSSTKSWRLRTSWTRQRPGG